MAFRRAFQAASAFALTVSKFAGAAHVAGSFSDARLLCALATLTKEIPILACTTRLVCVSKFSHPPTSVPLPELKVFALLVAPFQIPPPVQARSKTIADKTIS